MVRCATMTEEPEIVDEARHAKLVERHVYGDPGRRPQGRADWFRYSSAASVGIEIAVAIVGCTLLAGWIEREYTHWSPWTTVIGFGIGVGAAIKALVRTAKQYQREIAEREPAGTAKGGECPKQAGRD
jgi:F0F1-type ATP synthase assembly protein I